MPGTGTYLIAGLGNIGSEYSQTRHNMGFMILDAWAQASNVVFRTERYGDVAEVKLKGRTFVLLKPSTYMNLSGNAVRYWMQKLSITPENVMVICDDINLPFGTLRMRGSGSDGGHNGLKNIAECLETQEYPRIRCGVGHEFTQGAQVNYVLGEMSEDELKAIPELSKKIVSGLSEWIFMGLNRAMTTINTKK